MGFTHTEVWGWWEKPWISRISQRELCLPSPALLVLHWGQNHHNLSSKSLAWQLLMVFASW